MRKKIKELNDLMAKININATELIPLFTDFENTFKSAGVPMIKEMKDRIFALTIDLLSFQVKGNELIDNLRMKEK